MDRRVNWLETGTRSGSKRTSPGGSGNGCVFTGAGQSAGPRWLSRWPCDTARAWFTTRRLTYPKVRIGVICRCTAALPETRPTEIPPPIAQQTGDRSCQRPEPIWTNAVGRSWTCSSFPGTHTSIIPRLARYSSRVFSKRVVFELDSSLNRVGRTQATLHAWGPHGCSWGSVPAISTAC